MMAISLLLVVMTAPPDPAPEAKDIAAAWMEQAASIDSGDVELLALRDSRSRSFGAPDADDEKPRVRLRFDRDLRQLDALRLTVIRRDDRTQASESDPDRARVEFRNVLLEEELKGPQMVPKIEPATLIVDNSGVEKGQKLSLLDRLVAEGPLWAAQPLRFIDPEKLTLSGAVQSSGRLRLNVKQDDDRELELWTESVAPFRPLRIVQREKSHPNWQMDITWGAGESRFPTSYFVQTINGSGEALEFVEATLDRATTPLPSSIDFGHVEPNRDQPPPPDASAIQMRRQVRKLLDSKWLSIAAIGVCAIVILARSRRKPAVS
jgi:hypothetical protein